LELPFVRFTLFSAAAIGLLLASYGAVLGAGAIAGTVVVAKSTAAEATLVWDATPRIVELTANKISTAQGNTAIEIDAVKLMQSRAASLKGDQLKLRVVYVLSRQAASYGDPTLADRGPLMELSAKRADVLRRSTKWLEELAKGQKAPDLAIAILGEFPTSY
jgi:hypothetical protein